jgi:hypothetical protein
MSTLNLKAWFNDLTWDIPIERRITIIRGDSGTGKTTLVNNLESSKDSEFNVQFPLDIFVATCRNWNVIMSGVQDSLIVFDDLSIVETADFAKLVKDTEDKGNYFLIFSREPIGMEKLSRLSISVSSVLRFVISQDGKQHYTEPYYKFYGHSYNSISCTDILLEDKSAGKQFFEAVFGKEHIQSASSGKNTLVNDVIDKLKNDINCTLLVMTDMAAFGCNMDALYNLVLLPYKNRVYIDSKYECLEELLLQTNCLKDNIKVQTQLNDLCKYANKFISWERYFEQLLEDVTKDIDGIQYVHGRKLKYCWIHDCSECNSKGHRECHMLIENDKIDWLLKDTKYKKLLLLRDNMNNSSNSEE